MIFSIFNDFLTQLAWFHFLRPAWLWAVIPLAILIGWLWRQQNRSAWNGLCAPSLLQFLQHAPARQRTWLGLLAAGWFIAVIALAGPTWSQYPQALLTSPHAVVIVLDLSPSMEATDVVPSRRVRARFKVTDLLTHLHDAHVALVAFADDAFVITPLTTDYQTILNLLTNLAPDLMPVSGSRVDRALHQAQTLLTQTGFEHGSVVLITDDEPDERAFQAARRLRTSGFTVSVLAVGTPEGAPIPVAGGGFATDRDGRIIIAKVDTEKLQHLALQGGGRFSRLQPDDRDIQYISGLPTPGGLPSSPSYQEALQWQDQGPWLIVLLLPLAALAFRRGVWLVWIVIAGLGLPPPMAFAWSWADLWQRRDQQAAAAFREQDFERAAELADDPLQRGNALYRAGQYQKAVEAFKQVHNATGSYNLANTYVKLQRFQEALAAYEQALAQNPQLEDARYNRDQLKTWLQQQASQQQASQQQASQQQVQPSADSSQSDQSQNQVNPSAPQPSDQPARPADDPMDQTSKSPKLTQTLESPGSTDDALPQPDHVESAQPFAPSTSPPDVAEQHASPPQGPDPPMDRADTATQEQQQALEHWLQRIPDDPSGLLRRKLQHQAQQRSTLPSYERRY